MAWSVETILNEYRYVVRVRQSFFLAFSLVVAISLTFGVSMQTILSLCGQGCGFGPMLVSLFLLPPVIIFGIALSNRTVILLLEALDDPPLACFQARLSAIIGFEDKAMDIALISCFEIFPLVGIVVTMMQEAQHLIGVAFIFRGYTRGGLWFAHILTLFDTGLSIALCLSKGLNQKYQEAVKQDRALGQSLSDGEDSPRAARNLGRTMMDASASDMLKGKILGLGGFSLTLVVTILMYLARGTLTDFIVILVCVLECIALAMLNYGFGLMFPMMKTRTGNIMLMLVFALGASSAFLFMGNASSSSKSEARQPLFETKGTRDLVTPRAAEFSFPICSMRWGNTGGDEGHALTVIDMVPFAEHIHARSEGTIMRNLQEDFRGTHLDDVELVPGGLEEESTVGRWGVFRMNSSRTMVIAVRGFKHTADIAVIGSFVDVFILKEISRFIPVLAGIGKATIQRMLGFFNVRWWARCPEYWDPLVDEVMSRKSQAKADGFHLVLTGFGLGGLMASIAAARAEVPAVAFSPPGVDYGSVRYDIETVNIERYTVSLVPHGEIVAGIDRHPGPVQYFSCPAGVLDLKNCHTASLLERCGDIRNRKMEVPEGRSSQTDEGNSSSAAGNRSVS